MCGNWNRGIELARGKYIAMIHDDDMLSPYFMNAIEKAISDNSNPGIIGVDSINFNSSFINHRLLPKAISRSIFNYYFYTLFI